jgi:parallel beta-helix repeat protein
MAVRYALAFTLVLGRATAALGTTYFVRASGDDTADGLSPETAVASIRPAGRLLRNPGDRLVVGPGVYREGNIAPFGNGAPGAPIVLLADVAGALTGDPPGPVVIVPPNTPAATTGFIVYGRHDIVIQGFTVEGAADAGIQVRTRTRTGAHSSAIVLRDNTLRNGRLRGIHVTAVGGVTVADNTVTGNHGAGLRLSGAADGALRPQVSANVIEQNRLGIALERTAGAVVARNTLGANVETLYIADSNALALAGNELRGGRSKIDRTRDLEMTENAFERGVVMRSAAGGIVFTKNRFVGESAALAIAGESAHVVVRENQLQRIYVAAAAQLELAGNAGERLEVGGVGTVSATDNRFTGSMDLAAAALEMRHNRTADLRAAGADVRIHDNDIAGHARISGERATVAGNSTGALTVTRPRFSSTESEPSPDPIPFHVEGNVSTGPLRVGESGRPVPSAVIRGNAASGMLRSFARSELDVQRNDARGIFCVLKAPDAHLVLADNVSRRSAGAGLTVVGARRALIERNTSAENADCGLVARRTGTLTIGGNEFLQPGRGISVPRRSPATATATSG